MSFPFSLEEDSLEHILRARLVITNSLCFCLSGNVLVSLSLLKIFFYTCLFQLKYVCVWMLTQSCLTLCDPLNCSPPGSSVHRIFQVGIPEWVAVSFSRSSRPSDEPASCGSCVGRWGLHHWGHLVDLQCYSNVIQLRVYIVSFIFFSIMVY